MTSLKNFDDDLAVEQFLRLFTLVVPFLGPVAKVYKILFKVDVVFLYVHSKGRRDYRSRRIVIVSVR